jgi:pyruvate dehydrogenase E2 component (dihydrolipoamide acetyltransferase)
MAAAEGIDLGAVSGTGAGGKIVRADVERYLTQHAPAQQVPGRVRATPAARRAAREAELDLAGVSGSGPHGRVQEADVLAAAQALEIAPAAPSLPAAPPGVATIIPLEGMRKTIAYRMQMSYQQAPHVMFTLRADMTAANALRERINRGLADGEVRVSITAVIMKAVAWALRQYPLMNSHLINDTIYMLPGVDIGMAVALENGLIVPVIHEVDRKGIARIGQEIAAAAERARTGRLRADDLADGSFTVSNMGMYGIDHFTSILNPPQVGILAVAQTQRVFVPDENDQPVVRPLMTMTLSADHRVIDGAVAAQFIASVRDALEDPTVMLV